MSTTMRYAAHYSFALIICAASLLGARGVARWRSARPAKA